MREHALACRIIFYLSHDDHAGSLQPQVKTADPAEE